MTDIFTLVNDLFTETLTFVFMGVCIVAAVIVGKKLRDRHDAKVAAELAADDAAAANQSDEINKI